VGEKLQEADEVAVVRARHLDWYLALAENAALDTRGPDQPTWLARLDAEHGNLRLALAWCRDHDAAAGLRLAGALAPFCFARSYLTEGRRWLNDALAQASPRGSARVAALLDASTGPVAELS
jgi:non-specific serine/threonine protein kinase